MATLGETLVRLAPRSLRAQSVGLMLVAIALTTVAATSLFGRQYASEFRDEIGRRGDAAARILVRDPDLRLAASLDDPQKAGPALAAYAAGDEDVRFVALLGEDGAPIAFAPESLGREGLARLMAERDERNLLRFRQPILRGEEPAGELDFALGDAAAPKASKELGFVALGISADRLVQRMVVQTLVVVGLSGLLLMLVFLAYFRWIGLRLGRIASFAEKVAGGELRATIDDPVSDELGRVASALREMTARSHAMVAQLQQASESLTRGSAGLLESTKTSAQNAMVQATSVTEMSTAVEQLRAGFREAMQEAQSVITLADRSDEFSRTGTEAVTQSVGEMQAIRAQVEAIVGAMREMQSRSSEIDTIVVAVKEFAEEITVLSLNMAIEAARAGEHGRGITVVANEGRRLAEQSKVSTEKVRMVLRQIDEGIGQMTRVIGEGARRTEKGMQVARSSGEAIDRLAESIRASSGAAKGISEAIHDQSTGVDRIWEATRNIDQLARQTSEGMRMIETAAADMKALAAKMSETVSRFRV